MPASMRGQCGCRWALALALVVCGGFASTASAVTIDEFDTQGGNPAGIAPGPDGNLWYSRFDDGTIGRIRTSGALVAGAFGLRPDDTAPETVAEGPGNTVWYTDTGLGLVGRVGTSGYLGNSSLGEESDPGDLVEGPDGNMWVTEGGEDQVARVTPGGAVTEFSTPGGPDSITVGPDGALWYTLSEGDQIGRITTSGAASVPITLPPLPDGDNRGLGDITTGPDGNLWFTEIESNMIGRVTTAGALAEFPIPTPDSDPGDIVSAPDGALWFTEGIGSLAGGPGKVARITTAGAITEFVVPGALIASPFALTVGPDDKLWFTESPRDPDALVAANKIGRITLDPRPPGSTPPGGSRPPRGGTAPTSSGPNAPQLTAGRVASRSSRSARLTVSIDTKGSATSYHVECTRDGSRRRFGSRTTPGAGSPTSVTIPLTKLTPGKTYTCRVYASNAAGTGSSNTIRFKTRTGLNITTPRVRVVTEGKPFRIGVRASGSAIATLTINRPSGKARSSRLTRRLRLRAGRNSIRLPALRAGRFSVAITGRRAGARDRATSRLLVIRSANPRFTG